MNTHIRKSVAAVLSLLSVAAAQTSPANEPSSIIPAGTKIVLSLKEALSTRNAQDGDPVYAETVFPVIAGDRVALPSRTLVEGVVVKARRAGKMRGHAAIGIRFTSLIRSDGSVVSLAGPVSNTPGNEKLSVDSAGSSIVGDRQTSVQVDEEIHQVTRGAFHGTFLGLLFGGTVTAMRIGAGLGMAGGLAFALLSHPTDMRLRPGTQIQITLQSAVPLNPPPVPNARGQLPSAGSDDSSDVPVVHLVSTNSDRSRQ